MALQNCVVLLFIGTLALLRQSENSASASNYKIMPRDESCSVGKVENLPENKTEFKEKTKTGNHFIRFYNHDCNPCKRLTPVWHKVARECNHSGLCFGDCDCRAAMDICVDEGVSKVPNLTWFTNGDPVCTYDGKYEFDDIMKFVLDMIGDDQSNSNNSSGTHLATWIPTYLIVVGSVAFSVN